MKQYLVILDDKINDEIEILAVEDVIDDNMELSHDLCKCHMLNHIEVIKDEFPYYSIKVDSKNRVDVFQAGFFGGKSLVCTLRISYFEDENGDLKF